MHFMLTMKGDTDGKPMYIGILREKVEKMIDDGDHVIEIRADQCFCFEFRIYERFDEHDEKWIDKSINAAYGLIEVGHLWEEIPKEEYDREFKQFQENYQSVLNEETE